MLSVDKHQLSKQTLDVRPYYPSFGVLPPGFDSSVPRQPLPEELVVDCAPEVVAFVFQNKQHKHKVGVVHYVWVSDLTLLGAQEKWKL